MPAYGPTHSGLAAMAVIFVVVCCLPQRSECSCHFPPAWTGKWFQKGVQDPIRIANNTISSKGDCKRVDGDKFLLKSRTENCFVCVVIHEKHANVLQYKETYCSTSFDLETDSLESLCGEINGDALLYSMFRLDTPPVPCPFRGPFTFTYSHGQECSHPVSTVDACTVDSRLLFRFQACADVQGSESRVEELVCLALWKEGSTRYFVGKLENKMAKTDEDKLRCFVYEREKEHGLVLLAQSGDATCDGLLSATEGSRTMRLTKATHPHAKCHFPDWMWTHRYWRTLDGNQAYEFGVHHNSSSFRIVNSSEQHSELRVACTQEVETSPDLVQLVVHSTISCQSGYQCMRIHKRAGHVIEVQQGRKVNYVNEACSPQYFDPHRTPFTTLTTGAPDTKSCPLTGIYSLEGFHPRLKPILASELGTGQCTVRSTVTAGCDAGQDRIQFLAECASDSHTRAFQCHGSWEENGTYYLIASAVGSRMKYCMTFTENDKVMQFSGSPDSCIRSMLVSKDTYVTFNVTSKGACHSTDGARSVHHISVWTVSLLVLAFGLAHQRAGQILGTSDR